MVRSNLRTIEHLFPNRQGQISLLQPTSELYLPSSWRLLVTRFASTSSQPAPPIHAKTKWWKYLRPTSKNENPFFFPKNINTFSNNGNHWQGIVFDGHPCNFWFLIAEIAGITCNCWNYLGRESMASGLMAKWVDPSKMSRVNEKRINHDFRAELH